jgi:subtilisin family serine protease
VYDAFGGNGDDCYGHGTHVSGTVGGRTFGVAKGVLLRGVKVLDCSGVGSYSGIVAAVDWVTRYHINPAVANMSLGGPASAAVNTAVTNLVNSGVFVAVAAGNSADDACKYSPASAPAVFTTAASDYSDSRAYFSNWGTCVDAYAPGDWILSASIDYPGTEHMSGTSMASPHVAGVAALLKQRFGYSPSGITTWLKSNATVNVIFGNPAGTPNRMLYKGAL